jgi:cytochrome c553
MTIYFKCMLVSTMLLMPTASEANDADTQNVHIRTLAASCAACHGTQGNTRHPANIAPKNKATLAGMRQDYLVEQLNAFKDGKRSSTVMHHHAKGLTQQEIEQLATHFSAQQAFPPEALPHQKLGANHD